MSNAGNGQVTQFSPRGQVLRRWNANIKITSIAVSPQGQIVLSDVGDHEFAFFTPQGKILRLVGKQGFGPGSFFNYLFTLAFGTHGNLYAADHTDGEIQKFTPSGKRLRSFSHPLA